MRRTYNVYSWRKNLLEGLLVAGSVRSTRVQTEMTTIRCFSTFGRLLTENLNVLSSKRSGKNLSLSLKAAAMFRPVAEFPVSSARLRDAKMRNKVKLKGERERERNSASDPHPLQDIPRIVSFLPDGETLYEVGYEVRAKLEALLVLFKLWCRYILSRSDLSFAELLALALT